MSRRKGFVGGFADFWSDVRAARHCAVAIEAGRRPPESALRQLGLKSEIFSRYR